MAKKHEPVEGSVIAFSEAYFVEWTPPRSKGRVSRMIPEGVKLTVRSDGDAPIGWTSRSIGLSLARELVGNGVASITSTPEVEEVKVTEEAPQNEG